MKIYTRSGDEGSTGLIGGDRTGKDDPRVTAYGTVDELNAVLGIARSLDEAGHLDGALRSIQRNLHLAASMLASPDPARLTVAPLGPEATAELEAWIDRMDEELPPLDHFILPGGGRLGAELHRARTVCRRAERHVVALSRHAEVPDPVRVYLNRLSDFLFTAARLANRREGLEEEAWPGE